MPTTEYSRHRLPWSVGDGGRLYVSVSRHGRYTPKSGALPRKVAMGHNQTHALQQFWGDSMGKTTKEALIPYNMLSLDGVGLTSFPIRLSYQCEAGSMWRA